MTSRIEGGPITVLEAMACAKPVVSFKVGLVPEVIRTGENGFIVDDVMDMADRLEALRCDATLRKTIGKGARKSIEERWDFAKSVPRAALPQLYSEAIELHSKRLTVAARLGDLPGGSAVHVRAPVVA